MNPMSLILKKNQRGLASLPTVLAITMLIVSLGALVTALAAVESEAADSSSAAARARRYAEAGAQDAFERIARNRHYACFEPTASCPGGAYELEFLAGGCANQSACATVKVSGTATNKTVAVVGRAGKSARNLSAALTLDQSGAISDVSWGE